MYYNIIFQILNYQFVISQQIKLGQTKIVKQYKKLVAKSNPINNPNGLMNLLDYHTIITFVILLIENKFQITTEQIQTVLLRTHRVNFKIYLPLFLLYSFLIGTIKYPQSMLKGFMIECIYLSLRFSLPNKYMNDPINLALVRFIVELIVNILVELDNRLNWKINRIEVQNQEQKNIKQYIRLVGLYLLHLLHLIIINLSYRCVCYIVDKLQILDPTSVLSQIFQTIVQILALI